MQCSCMLCKACINHSSTCKHFPCIFRAPFLINLLFKLSLHSIIMIFQCINYVPACLLGCFFLSTVLPFVVQVYPHELQHILHLVQHQRVFVFSQLVLPKDFCYVRTTEPNEPGGAGYQLSLNKRYGKFKVWLVKKCIPQEPTYTSLGIQFCC